MRSRLRSVSVATFAGVFCWLASAIAQDTPEERLSDEAELARIVSIVEAAKYEECDARLSRLLNPHHPRPLKNARVIETARIYHATCLVGLGKDDQADEPLRAALRKNPQMRPPDSLIFPARVVDRFLRVREELYSELRLAQEKDIERARREAKAKQQRENEQWARMLQLERLARQEVVVQKNSRFVALLPFGAGQFQNGNQPLAWTFLGSETLLAAGTIASTIVYGTIKQKADRLQAQRLPVQADVNGRLQDWHLALTITSYTWLGVSLLGVAEAQLSFVPEVKRVRERPAPKVAAERAAVVVRPDVSFGPGELKLGVTGAF
jgi:hypothetical protein